MGKNDTMGEKLKTLRESCGLNQSQIAAYLGVDQSYVSKWEKGERKASVEALEKLCSLYGCTISELDQRNESLTQLRFAFRSSQVSTEDLNAIATIHQIALNLRQMRQISEERTS